MTNEVQLIAWKDALEDSVQYTGTCIEANKFNEQFKVKIAPIAGVANAGDLRGYWMKLTNELGQQDYFPICNSYTSGGNWLVQPNITLNLFQNSLFDFSNFATYEIVSREFISENVDGGVTTDAAYYRIS